jgi:hypothetical protein
VLDELLDRLDQTSFRVKENPQVLGIGQGGGAGGDLRGGRTGGRQPSIFYNYYEKGHMGRDCPQSRWPWCSHYGTNGNTVEDCLELIEKWEYWVHQRGTNFIIS